MDGFEILSKLGDGAYSVVYKVRRKEDGNIYALKKVKLQNLNDKEKQNALNEVRILASVKSTFVISYKEAFIEENDKSLGMVMEFADKGDLYQKIVQFKKMGCLIEEIDVWRIFIQMTRGLKALHDLKILHRDLKSANIFLFNDGSAKIGDLNVSKVARKGLGYTQTGTPYYASPEVWKDKPYDSKSDIWSLGCVTYEMLTLHPPFRAENMEGLYNKVCKGQYGKIDERYSPDISELIKLLLKVNPQERPSCSQILKHPLVKKRLEFFQAQSGFENEDIENMDEGVLLRTIRIPKNILFLSDKLPEANYAKRALMKGKAKTNDNKSSNSNNNTSNCLPNIKLQNKLKITDDNFGHNNNKSISEHKYINKKIISSNNLDNNGNGTSKNSDILKNANTASSESNTKNNLITNAQNSYIQQNSNTINNERHGNNREYNEDKRINNLKIIQNNYNCSGNNKDNLNQIRKINVKKNNDFKKYLNDIGINDVYKMYAPHIETSNNCGSNKNNERYKMSDKYKIYLPNIYNQKRNGSQNVVNKIGNSNMSRRIKYKLMQ